MTVTADQLAAYTGATSSDTPGFVQNCLDQATALVTSAIGNDVDPWASSVPEVIVDRAVLECASELVHRKQAPNGIAQFATLDGSSPIRVARDPMVAAWPILAPFLPPGIA